MSFRSRILDRLCVGERRGLCINLTTSRKKCESKLAHWVGSESPFLNSILALQDNYQLPCAIPYYIGPHSVIFVIPMYWGKLERKSHKGKANQMRYNQLNMKALRGNSCAFVSVTTTPPPSPIKFPYESCPSVYLLIPPSYSLSIYPSNEA